MEADRCASGNSAGLAGGQNRLAVARSDLQVIESAWIELGLLSKHGELTEIGSMLSPDSMWEDRFLYWTGPQSEAWNEAEKRLRIQS